MHKILSIYTLELNVTNTLSIYFLSYYYLYLVYFFLLLTIIADSFRSMLSIGIPYYTTIQHVQFSVCIFIFA